VDRSPIDILRHAENKEQVWQLAQVKFLDENQAQEAGNIHYQPWVEFLRGTVSGYQYFIDGSWKESHRFAGLGCFCSFPYVRTQEMGANLRRSLTSLHTEVEVLVWAMQCMIGQEKRSLQTAQIWWRWCLLLKSGQLSLHTRRWYSATWRSLIIFLYP